MARSQQVAVEWARVAENCVVAFQGRIEQNNLPVQTLSVSLRGLTCLSVNAS